MKVRSKLKRWCLNLSENIRGSTHVPTLSPWHHPWSITFLFLGFEPSNFFSPAQMTALRASPRGKFIFLKIEGFIFGNFGRIQSSKATDWLVTADFQLYNRSVKSNKMQLTPSIFKNKNFPLRESLSAAICAGLMKFKGPNPKNKKVVDQGLKLGTWVEPLSNLKFIF